MAGWTPLICPDGGLTVITGHSRLLCAVLCGKRGKAGIGKADRIMNTGTVVHKKGVMCLLLSGTAAVPVGSGGGFPFSIQSGRRGEFSARTVCPARAFSRARPHSTRQRYQGNNGKLAVHGDCRYQLYGRCRYAAASASCMPQKRFCGSFAGILLPALHLAAVLPPAHIRLEQKPNGIPAKRHSLCPAALYWMAVLPAAGSPLSGC